MKRYIFWGGIAASVAILLLIGLTVITLVDVNRYKGDIEAAVFEATGRTLKLSGPIQIGFSLKPTIVAEDVQFGNAKWGTRPLMADVGRLEISLSIINLFTGEFEVSKVRGKQVSLFVESHADGRSNFDFGSGEAGEGASDESGDVSLPSIEIFDADISYYVERTGRLYQANLARAEVANGLFGMWVEIEGELEDLPLNLVGWFSGGASDFKIDDLAIYFGRLELTGEVSAKRASAGAAFDIVARIEANQADIKPILDELRDDEPGSEGDLFEAPLDFSIFDLANGTVDVSVAALRYDNLNLRNVQVRIGSTGRQATMEGSALYQNKAVSVVASLDAKRDVTAALKVNFAELDLGEMLVDAGIVSTVDAAADGQFDLKTRGRTPRELIAGLSGSVDGTLNFELLDLTEFAEKDELGVDGNGELVFSRERLPFDMIDGFHGDIKISAQKIVFRDVSVSDVVLPIRFAGREISSSLTAVYREKEFSLSQTADLRNVPVVEFDFAADDFDLGALLAQLDVTDLVRVRADMALHGRAVGDTPRALAAGFTGSFNLVTGEGEIASSAFELIATDLAWALVPKGGSGGTAKLTCLVNRIDFTDGIGNVAALALVTKRMRTSGKGSINLRDETLDLTLYPKPNDTSLLSLSTPLRITGNLASPTIRPDAGSLLLDAATAIGVGVLTGGVGALLPLMSLQNFDAENADACLTVLSGKEGGAASSGVTGAVGSGVEAISDGAGKVIKGVGDILTSPFD